MVPEGQGPAIEREPSVALTPEERARIVVRDPDVHDDVRLLYGFGLREGGSQDNRVVRWLVEDLLRDDLGRRLRDSCPADLDVFTKDRSVSLDERRLTLYVRVRTSRDGWQAVERAVGEGFHRLRLGQVRPEELEAARTRVAGRLTILFSKSKSVADFAVTAPMKLLSGSLLGTLRATTIEDIQRFCSDCFTEQGRFAVLYKPVLTVPGAIRLLTVVIAGSVLLTLALVLRRMRRHGKRAASM